MNELSTSTRSGAGSVITASIKAASGGGVVLAASARLQCSTMNAA
jgi:hypothetical protein